MEFEEIVCYSQSIIILILVVGYLINLGKCKNCKTKISYSYLIVEVFIGILFVYGYQRFGFNFEYLAYLIFYSALIIIFFTDLKYYLILDKITYPISIIGLIFVFFNLNECIPNTDVCFTLL